MYQDPNDAQRIDDDVRKLAQYWEGTHDEAEFEITHMGFNRLPRPQFTCPPLDPKALSTMNLVEYGEAHMRYVAWLNYAENTLSYVKSMLMGIKRQMDELHNRLRIEYSKVTNSHTGKPLSIDDRKLMAESNPRYLELLRERTKLESMKELMDSHASACKESANVISRHIELRKMDIERQGIGNNLPGRGMYQLPR